MPLRVPARAPPAAACPAQPRTNRSQKREKAQEDLYIRQHEKEQLEALRESLKKQKEQLDTLEKKM